MRNVTAAKREALAKRRDLDPEWSIKWAMSRRLQEEGWATMKRNYKEVRNSDQLPAIHPLPPGVMPSQELMEHFAKVPKLSGKLAQRIAEVEVSGLEGGVRFLKTVGIFKNSLMAFPLPSTLLHQHPLSH